MSRRRFLGQACGAAAGLYAASWSASAQEGAQLRPNILFAIADDWSWPHASAYGTKGVNTPAFDRVAREGCLFTNAFVAAPQCSPNRAACLTGRHIWQIGEAGTHASIFPNTHTVYPDLLEEAGYHVGWTGKAWGPGDWKRGGWSRNPAGNEYNDVKVPSPPASGINNVDYAANFDRFLEKRAPGQPFCFWYGGKEPHRKYEDGVGGRAGKSIDDVSVPSFLPDDPLVRSDMLDYFFEIEWFDLHLGKILARLEELGELDRTLVVVTSDNGMPFPRAKANVYEYGIHMPLAVRWPLQVPAGRTSDALVSFVDLAPTFLAAAGVPVPEEMVGRSLLGRAAGEAVPEEENYVLCGRERHTHARYDNLGYPCRAIRTAEYLYILNMKPDRWPAGDPPGYFDIDASPTKSFVIEHRDERPRLFELAVGKRPEEELYDIRRDPGCVDNLAETQPDVCRRLRARLMTLLEEQGDPRALGKGDIFESYPRVSEMRPELGGFAVQGEYNPKYRP